MTHSIHDKPLYNHRKLLKFKHLIKKIPTPTS